MRRLPPNRRAALIASLAAIIASSSLIMVSTHGRGAGGDVFQFILGLLVGVSAALLVAAFVKLRPR